MTAIIWKNGIEYHVLNHWCIGKPCLRLGHYHSSKSVENEHVCVIRQVMGCPEPEEKFDATLAEIRREMGYQDLLKR